MIYKNLLSQLKKEKKTWLVTGAAGFIGSNLVEALLLLNQNVIGLDNFATGYEENIVNIKDKNFEFIEADITNMDKCMTALNGVDYVLHQAALGSIPRSINDPINTNNSNIVGFLNLLTAAKESNIKRFIFAGSSSTYGDHPALPKKEENIGNPLSPYAITKFVNELYAETFNRHYGLEFVGLRYFNVFGKRQRKEGPYAAVIPKWITGILEGSEIFINGDGNTSRDFCYIENVIQANILSALSTNKKSTNQIYNVAVNDQTTLNELYIMISSAISGIDSSIKIPLPIHRDFRAGDIMHSRADITKAKTFLGYDPDYPVDRGIKETVKWYMSK